MTVETDTLVAVLGYLGSREFHTVSAFLSLAFAVNFLQLWEGVSRWVSKRMSQSAMSDRTLAQVGPADRETINELEHRIDRLERHTQWTLKASRFLAAILAAIIYVVMFVVPPTAIVRGWGMLGIFGLGFGMPVYYLAIVLMNRARSGLLSRWVNKRTREAARRAEEEGRAARHGMMERRPPQRPAGHVRPSQRQRLLRHLELRGQDELLMSFGQIEQVIRTPLPSAAHRYAAWWRPHSEWVGDDWTMSVTVDAGISFRRVGSRGAPV